jgi:hypothetical protein
MRAKSLLILLLLAIGASFSPQANIAVADPFNPRLAIQVGSDGHFNMGAFPDPSTGGAGSNSWDLMFTWPSEPYSSFTTFRIDGLDNTFGKSGTVIEAPTDIDPLTNRSRWQIGDIEVTQLLQVVFNNQTGQEDVARISYTVRNTGTSAHTVGNRIMIDTEINGNDGAVFRVPGIGLISHETEFAGAAIPDVFQEFFGVNDSTHVAASTVKSGGDIAPDRLVFAQWRHLYNTPYDYVINPSFDFTDPSVARPDSAYALYWNPAALAPGTSRTFVTYYGLAQLTVDLRPPLALGITGPTTLSVTNGQYTPNPFDVTASILNSGAATATNVQLTLNLPSELTLAGGTSAVQAIGDLLPGQERQVSWNIEPHPSNPAVATTLSYSVVATASNTESKTVSRQIILPPAGTSGGNCTTSANAWRNTSVAAQTDTFIAAFDAIPGRANMDGVTGFSANLAAAYTDLAVIFRFNPQGFIDARNGSAYQATNQIPYSAGTRYHVRMVVRIPNHTYDVFVTAPGGVEQTVASNFAFRTEQNSVGRLSNWGVYAKLGSHQICGVTVTPSGSTPSAVSGRVTTANNTPIAGVTISAGAGRSASTDSNGNYTLSGLVAGSYTLTPSKSGYAFAPATRSVNVPPGQSGLNFSGTATGGGNCISSAGTWQNTSITAQTGSFTAEFDATPNTTSMDGVMGLSASPATDYANLAAIVRFSPQGVIDARNGGAYQAASQIAYSASVRYHFRLVVRVASHTYDAYVTAPGATERTVGANYAFRTEQSSVSSLSNFGIFAKSGGSMQICGLALSQPPATSTAVILPVYPNSANTASIIMQGGTLYRYFRLVDGSGAPVANAQIVFSRGNPATSDANGFFTYSVAANTIGNPGSYQITIQQVRLNNQSLPISGSTAFGVEIVERRYSNAWSYGMVRQVSAGVNTGLIAYVKGGTNGGLKLTLSETNPTRTDDDRVEMEEKYAAEVGSELGVGIRRDFGSIGRFNASATTERTLRTFGALKARFAQPYSDAERKAQGMFLGLSVLDSVSKSGPVQPMLVSMLRAGKSRIAYLNYIKEQSAGMAIKVTPLQANVSANILLTAKLDDSVAAKTSPLGITFFDTGASQLLTTMLTDRGSEYSTAFAEETSFNLTLLSPQILYIKTHLIGLLEHKVQRIQKEYFFDSATNRLKRIELTLSSQGNPVIFTDVTKKQVAIKITINGAGLNLGLAEKVGQAQSAEDIRSLLTAVPVASYEVQVEDGSSVSVVPKITIPLDLIDISFGQGLEVESLRNLVRERGVYFNGRQYVTEAYASDASVARAGKNWTDLTANAIGSLWLSVRDTFNWVKQQVTSGVEWTVDVTAQAANNLWQGAVHLVVPPGAQLHMPGTAGAEAAQPAATYTITAISWVPATATQAGAQETQSVIESALGDKFVVGGIYEFQPGDLTISPAATLSIEYADTAVAGVNENLLRLFHWDAQTNTWQPIPANVDPANNTVSASVTRLGTYALGYDATPPQITITTPRQGSRIGSGAPLISALIGDSGVGIDPATPQMQLDGRVVSANYNIGTGELTYLPNTALVAGIHRLTVSARDVLGNRSSQSSVFIVDDNGYLYVPLARRN